MWSCGLSAAESFGATCMIAGTMSRCQTGADTVEHFRPKEFYPADAYEWSAEGTCLKSCIQ
jgi:hypothetical protein